MTEISDDASDEVETDRETQTEVAAPDTPTVDPDEEDAEGGAATGGGDPGMGR